MPVGKWVKRTADSVLFTCYEQSMNMNSVSVRVPEATYLATRSPRSHNFNFHVCHVEQLIFRDIAVSVIHEGEHLMIIQ